LEEGNSLKQCATSVNFEPRGQTNSGADNCEDQWNTISLSWTV